MTSETPIRKWVITISGFLQSLGVANGNTALWSRLHARFAGGGCCVMPLRWSDDMRDVAEMIWRLRPNEGTPLEIVIAGYSWGGMSAINLCELLERRGLPVRRLVLCDAVYRHNYALGNWRAFWPYMALLVPPNVRGVDVFRQRQNYPRGHNVIAVDSRVTSIIEQDELHVIHQYADDSPEFHEAVLAASETIAGWSC